MAWPYINMVDSRYVYWVKEAIFRVDDKIQRLLIKSHLFDLLLTVSQFVVLCSQTIDVVFFDLKVQIIAI